MAEYLYSNNEEQITLNKLKELKDSFLKESSCEVFTTEWVKQKLPKCLKDEIITAKIDGQPNVVTFRTNTSIILRIFLLCTKVQ